MHKRKLCALFGLMFVCCLVTIGKTYSQKAVQRIILIGDGGDLKNGRNAVVDAVRKQFPPDEKTTILFLGDNIYPLGMPEDEAGSFQKAKATIDYEIGLVQNSKAKTFFIPGNHDWAQGRPYGLQQELRQQRYIDSLHIENVKMLPTDGCPGPVEIPVGDNIVILVVDSQWFLHGYEKPGIESNCPCKNEDELLTMLEEMISRNRKKLVLFATHHPFRTHGPHGGYFTLKQHIFPLTDASPGLYIPLPVIGSIYPITRGIFGNIQDAQHPIYKKMVSSIEKILLSHPQVIFVAGHEHSLQWIKEGNANYIVSGSGSEKTRVKKGANSLYAHEGYGFSAIEMYDNNEIRLNFFGVNENNITPLLDTALMTFQQIQDTVRQISVIQFPDSVVTAAGAHYNEASGFKKFMLGENYRKEWAKEVKFRTIDITKEKGGLKILQRGGGHQTKSLRFQDSSGKQWVLRSIEKSPEAAIPPALRQTFAVDIVQDQISAAHPYGSLVVPLIADAAKIPHTNPEIVFIPDDPALGKYRKDFANMLALFEEREAVEGRTYNTAKVLEEIQTDNDNTVNQKKILQARLLDMYIADWDRHDDQWRWVDEKQGNDKVFAAVPRDRDQAFFVNNGFIPNSAKSPWLLPFLQGFESHIKNINGWNFGARYFDRSFLNELSEQEWSKQTDDFIQNMPDEVIDKAVHNLPPDIYGLKGEKIKSTLIERKKYLKEEAMKYYHFLAKTVSITGSDKREKFTVKGLDNDQLDITVQKIGKNGEAGKSIYHRVFTTDETKEIRLYALKGNDELQVEGKIPSITIRWIGGEGNDSLVNSSGVQASKKIFVYDMSKENNFYPDESYTRSRVSDDPSVNYYNRNDFKYNRTMPLVTAGFNQDDGFIIGAGVKHIGHGFRKEPQAVIHEFGGRVALNTGAFNFAYRGLYTDVIGKTDLAFNATVKAPDNTINFFGFGNETEYINEGNKPYKNYRTTYTDIKAELLLRNNFSPNAWWGIGPTFEFYNMAYGDNSNRYIGKPPFQGLDSASIYNKKTYATVQGYVEFDSRKDPVMPNRGIHWYTSAQAAKGLNDNSKNFVKLQSELSMYLSLNIPARMILSNRTGGGTIFGDFEYFQALTLGNSANLRGYRNYRFAGRSSFYNNTELRLKLFDFDSYLIPGSFGLIGFFDVGRVWYDDEESKTWHTGYGGGLYVSPINRLVITVTYGFSKEDQLPDFSLGFKF